MATEKFTRELEKMIPGSICYNNCWMYHHKAGNHTSGNNIQKPGKINASGFIFCRKGEIRISSNFRTYDVGQNNLLLYQPHNVLSVENFEGCDCYVIAIEEGSLSDYALEMQPMPEFLEKIHESPMICLDEKESMKLINVLESLFRYIDEKEETPFKSPIVKAGLNILSYTIGEILYQHLSSKEFEKIRISRENNHFNRFIRVLADNYLKEREVSFYAEQLHLTARYLTTTVRKMSGYTVYEWICRFIIKDAKYLLSHTDLTVQQIAYELEFSNQSFFGKFFKKHTGMSPGQYRKSGNTEN